MEDTIPTVAMIKMTAKATIAAAAARAATPVMVAMAYIVERFEGESCGAVIVL